MFGTNLVMDNFALLIAYDGEGSDELLIYDMGTKEAMNNAFMLLVTEGKEDGNFYLCRVLKSAEVVNSGELNVVDHGDEDESSS